MAGDISKKTVMVLLVLAIILSVILTLIVLRSKMLKSTQSAGQPETVVGYTRPTQGAKVGVVVVESKETGEEAGEGAAAGGG